MPLKLVLDENLRDHSLWLAIDRHNAESTDLLDVVRVGDGDGPKLGVHDPELLAWAAAEDRILIGLDKGTLPRHLSDFCAAGKRSPGVIFLRSDLSIVELVELLALVTHASEAHEWENTYRWIP
jgi:hypothetical protein